jgi:hypothetical protein
MTGTFTHDLLANSRFHAEIQNIRTASNKQIYRSTELQQTRTAVYGILAALLDSVVPLVVEDQSRGAQPQEWRKLIGQQNIAGAYENILRATDIVTDLRDAEAFERVEKLAKSGRLRSALPIDTG